MKRPPRYCCLEATLALQRQRCLVLEAKQDSGWEGWGKACRQRHGEQMEQNSRGSGGSLWLFPLCLLKPSTAKINPPFIHYYTHPLHERTRKSAQREKGAALNLKSPNILKQKEEPGCKATWEGATAKAAWKQKTQHLALAVLSAAAATQLPLTAETPAAPVPPQGWPAALQQAANGLPCAATAAATAAALASAAAAQAAPVSPNESLWPLFKTRMRAHTDDSFAPHSSPSPLLQIENCLLKQQLRDRATKYVLSAMANCLEDRHLYRINYSPKYTDNAFEYRVVSLPLDHPFLQLPQPILLNFAAAPAAAHFVVAAAAVAGEQLSFLEETLMLPSSTSSPSTPLSPAVAERLSSDTSLVAAAAEACAAAVAADRAAAASEAAAAAATARAAATGAALEGSLAAVESERVAAAVREAAAAAAAAQAEAAVEEAPVAAAAVGMLFERSLQLPEAAWRSLGVSLSKAGRILAPACTKRIHFYLQGINTAPAAAAVARARKRVFAPGAETC
ncbi:Holliday junction resolvase MOC1, chloroplastic-like [Cyclospora cayetanensis]|uniref:Holliday junction resolvase MOC1, chloroplastic-like n=1 Tax=Cyclospora cayetanensis TaxID=88456 RepID=A0A6P6S0P0_9EIME|nr:Holliday junction resolvase MOC1, chloroplastic-like [Cyclospora cayetanensis]